MTDTFVDERRDLAAVFRGAAMSSGQAGMCSHFSLRVAERPRRVVPDDIAKKTVKQFGREREHRARLHLDALRRKLDHEHPEYAS
jgi:hypothetical protein